MKDVKKTEDLFEIKVLEDEKLKKIRGGSAPKCNCVGGSSASSSRVGACCEPISIN